MRYLRLQTNSSNGFFIIINTLFQAFTFSQKQSLSFWKHQIESLKNNSRRSTNFRQLKGYFLALHSFSTLLLITFISLSLSLLLTLSHPFSDRKWSNNSTDSNNNYNSKYNLINSCNYSTLTPSASTNRRIKPVGSLNLTATNWSQPRVITNITGFSSYNNPGFPGMERKINLLNKQSNFVNVIKTL